MAEPRRALVRQLPREPLSPGGGCPRVQGRHRRAVPRRPTTTAGPLRRAHRGQRTTRHGCRSTTPPCARWRHVDPAPEPTGAVCTSSTSTPPCHPAPRTRRPWAGQCALRRRRSLHAVRRHLRRVEAGAGTGCARPGTRRRRAGWRVAGASATIDPDMVLEPALPMIQACHRGRRRRHGGPDGAQTFWDDPVTMYIFPKEAAPRGWAASLLSHPDEGRLPPLRWVLRGRRVRGLGHLGPGRQAAAHRPARHPHHGAGAALCGDQSRRRPCASSTASSRRIPTNPIGTWRAWGQRSTSRARASGAR